MKIAHYSYDDINNPFCGGGGAFRELEIHKRLSERHYVIYITGKYKGAKNKKDTNFTHKHLGIPLNYLISRISFAIYATIHACFVKADIIVIGYSVYAPVLSFILRRKKTVLEIYHLTSFTTIEKYGILGVLPWLAERIALKYNHNFITLTKEMAQHIKSHYKNKTAIETYTGFDESLLDKNSNDNRYILCFGRIDIHMKGLDLLMDAFDSVAKGNDIHLHFGGRGSLKDISWLKNRINKSPHRDRVFLTENATHDQKRDLFKNATFVCMPSRFEGWCIAAVEAAASSKATIGTDIMGFRESIKNNETGLLIPPENVNALSDAILKLLNNKELREKLGKNGYHWAQNFSWDRIVDLQEKAYKTILSV